MTPDERLREAVGAYIQLVEFGGSTSDQAWAAFKRMRVAYIDDMVDRPCVNASEVLGPRGFWAGFWRGLCVVGDSRFFWWMSGMVLGAGLQGMFP